MSESGHGLTQKGSILVSEPEPGTPLSWEEACEKLISIFGMKLDTVVGSEKAYICQIDDLSPITLNEILLVAKELKTWAIEIVIDWENQTKELWIYMLEPDDDTSSSRPKQGQGERV